MREYARAIYDLLPQHEGYSFEAIDAAAPMAHMVQKNPQFVSDQGKTFMGMPVPVKMA